MTQEEIDLNKKARQAIYNAITANGDKPTQTTLAIATGVACSRTYDKSVYRQVNTQLLKETTLNEHSDSNNSQIDTISAQLIINLKKANLPSKVVFNMAFFIYSELCDTAKKGDALNNIKHNFKLGWNKAKQQEKPPRPKLNKYLYDPQNRTILHNKYN